MYELSYNMEYKCNSKVEVEKLSRILLRFSNIFSLIFSISDYTIISFLI